MGYLLLFLQLGSTIRLKMSLRVVGGAYYLANFKKPKELENLVCMFLINCRCA